MAFRSIGAAVWLLAATALGQSSERGQVGRFDASVREYVRESVLAERDFSFLYGITQDAKASDALSADPALSAMGAARWRAADAADASCKDDLHCIVAALQFSAEQIAAISDMLRSEYQRSEAVRSYVHRALEANPVYSLDLSQRGADLLVANWERSARALNQLIAVYGEGAKPRYGEIDSMTYAADSRTYPSLLHILLDGLRLDDAAPAATNTKTLFFTATLRFAVRLLEANSRDEAGRFWPLATGQNRSAIEHIADASAQAYPYSVILIPGAGSELPGISLSPWGRERLRLGVATYRAGRAPYIMVSGGFVHPSQTSFCEAIEMKRYLMQVYAIPESAILVEPYARHTTTNLRNAVREIYAYGLPETKPLLIVSDASQSSYIESTTFGKRNLDELGYEPVRLGRRLSPTEQEAMPSVQSLFRDPLDPLDP